MLTHGTDIHPTLVRFLLTKGYLEITYTVTFPMSMCEAKQIQYSSYGSLRMGFCQQRDADLVSQVVSCSS